MYLSLYVLQLAIWFFTATIYTVLQNLFYLLVIFIAIHRFPDAFGAKIDPVKVMI